MPASLGQKKREKKNACVFRRDKNCRETGNCRRTYRSVKKRSSKNAFAKLCTRSNSARIFFSFFFFSGFFKISGENCQHFQFPACRKFPGEWHLGWETVAAFTHLLARKRKNSLRLQVNAGMPNHFYKKAWKFTQWCLMPQIDHLQTIFNI